MHPTAIARSHPIPTFALYLQECRADDVKRSKAMTSVVRIAQTGGPEVMKIETISPANPGPGEVWLEQEGHRHVNELGVTERLITGYDDRP
jgi:hypothetical protein